MEKVDAVMRYYRTAKNMSSVQLPTVIPGYFEEVLRVRTLCIRSKNVMFGANFKQQSSIAKISRPATLTFDTQFIQYQLWAIFSFAYLFFQNSWAYSPMPLLSAKV
jgi:hypothetical protein